MESTVEIRNKYSGVELFRPNIDAMLPAKRCRGFEACETGHQLY